MALFSPRSWKAIPPHALTELADAGFHPPISAMRAELLEPEALEVMLFAPLALETHLLLQVDKGDQTADPGGDPSTAIFLTLSSVHLLAPQDLSYNLGSKRR